MLLFDGIKVMSIILNQHNELDFYSVGSQSNLLK